MSTSLDLAVLLTCAPTGERQDLQSVRKRMLKRELEKRRGKLKENFDRSNFQRATQMDKVISAVGAEHDEFISSLQVSVLLIACLYICIDTVSTTSFPSTHLSCAIALRSMRAVCAQW